jgi:hypothetical protein
MVFDDEIEKDLQAKGKTGPRITTDALLALIVNEQYHHFDGTTVMVCALTLANGFTVVGTAASASVDNFDGEIGRKVAKADAINKIWPLEGYRLRQELHDQEQRDAKQ